MIKRSVRMPLLATGAAVALVASMTTLNPAGAAPAKPGNAHRSFGHSHTPRNTISHGLPRALEQGLGGLPASVPHHGRYAFLLRLNSTSTLAAYRQNRPLGKSTAASAARSQFARIKAQQADVVHALPSGSHVLYKSHSVLAGVAVTTDVHNYGALRSIPGVQAVYPIAPKSVSNSYAMPLQHAPQAWQAHGDLGANSTIAIIDTGIDYTHANLGGSGDPADYDTAHANETADPTYPDTDKVVGGYDFVGDTYNADPTTPPTDPHPYQPNPIPDNNPIDCNGHGSHVAGIAAGYGENPDGSTFTDDYLSLPTDAASYQPLFRIGPGMAPLAHLLAYKVFGCEGSTDIVGAAIDRAADPNQDGDPSDHADVINMSLGSDYGSPQDGDSVESNLASKLGITVVTAAGNGGDYYDVGGSPGDAVRTIDVANSVDAYNQIDTLHATVGGNPQDYGAQRSVAYDWATDPDLAGDVVKLSDPTNLDGCDPLSATDAAAVAGKIAFLEWTDNDATRRCGSAARSQNVFDAGAIGAILGEDRETFTAGITGSADIPVVQVIKSASDEIEAALDASTAITVTGTSAGDFSQLVPGDNDKVNSSSSRGIRGAGNVKPDVAAVGTSVFSTAMGTGNEGVSFTGTSMATPMVAGLAALVKSMRKDWTPEEVKADIMNTAGQDLYTGDSHTGKVYAPNRVGAGRIRADRALDNLVVAYDASDSGAVSVSFGPVAITGKTTLSKTVKVVNKSLNPASFKVGYHAITTVPGVSYHVSPSSITLGAGATKTLTVKLVVTDRTKLTKTHDATKAAKVDLGGGLKFGTETLADASGRIQLTPTNGYTGPALRVPVYSAPRPASTMSERKSVTVSGKAVQHGSFKLSGTGVKQGSGNAKIRSVVSGFELQATSGKAPSCSATVTSNCVHYADERSADLKYVGSTSDYPLMKSLGYGFGATGEYVAITTQRPWGTPVGPQEFDIFIDTNRDGVSDAVVYNTRYGESDVFLSELVDITDPEHPFIRDDELIDDRFGNPATFPTDNGPFTLPGLDTALYDSDTMVLPIAVGGMLRCTVARCGVKFPALPGFSSSHTRIRYGIASFGQTGVVDRIGVNVGSGKLTSGHLTLDVKNPGVEAYNPSILTYPTLLGPSVNSDMPGVVLTVRRDKSAYKTDGGKGLLMIHFHNKVGAKAKVVTLKTK